MRIIGTIDHRIVTEVEKLSHHVQRLTGYDCITQAQFAAVAMVLINAYEAATSDFLGTTLVSGFMALYFLHHFYGSFYDDLREDAEDRAVDQVANPFKIWTPGVVIRVGQLAYGLWLMSFSDASFLSSADMYVLLAWANLASCDPLPACRGKLGEWIDTALTTLTPIEQDNRQ